MRDARNYPEALQFLGKTYANALMRLDPDINGFAEVPDSASCWAPITSTISQLPYLTIRSEEKADRITKGKIIGNIKMGGKYSIIDDVITDGMSKIDAYNVMKANDVNILPLIVLVDRQQGWRKKFSELGIDLKVWSGMTLHHVRKYLIEKGLMIRCDKSVEEKNPIIIALDGKSWYDILPIIDELRTTGCILKVNDLAFNKGIETIVPNLSVYGRVMLDLKGHDIENTWKNIANLLRDNPPWAVTVHASGSKNMVKAVVDKLADTNVKVLAVTVLTSIDGETCQEIYNRQPLEQVLLLAKIARDAGAHGIVCSPEEVAEVRKICPNMTLITPGIRYGEKIENDDQKRIATPKVARENGANYLVIGRQILTATDPVEEVTRLLKEELKVA
ncbi:MAG: orotidine-5'-phosphate decarboxylase [bacterium]